MSLVVANSKEKYAVIGVDRATEVGYWKIASINEGIIPLVSSDVKVKQYFENAKENLYATYDCYAYSLADVVIIDIGLDVEKVFEVKNEKLSKAFWSTSSFMAPYYNLLLSTSNWLVSKGIKRKEAENYTRELFLALSEDSIAKNRLSLKQLVLKSQTPGGTNEYVLRKLKKKKFYKVQQKVLNSIFKKF